MNVKELAKKTYSEGKKLEAFYLVEKCLAQNENDEDLILLKAQILQDNNIWGYLDKKNQKISPLDLVEHVIELNPRNAMAWNEKGILLAQSKITQLEALNCYEKAIKFQPFHYDIIYNKAALLLDMNFCEEAILLLQKCISQRPKDDQLFFDKARAHAQLNQRDEMLECLKQAFSFSDSDYLKLIIQNGHPSFKSYANDSDFQKLCFAK